MKQIHIKKGSVPTTFFNDLEPKFLHLFTESKKQQTEMTKYLLY